ACPGATASAWKSGRLYGPISGASAPFLGRGGRHDTIDVFQVTIEIAASGQQQTGILLERLFIRVPRLVKGVKLPNLPTRFGIDPGGFGVRLAAGLLGLTVRFRAYAVQLALLLAANLGAGAVAFRAVTGRNASALRNHALIDPLLHLAHIVDALDAHIDEF